jgi:crotonobetainyl-CoA:carnitine CoA-transferase CaiB-like acyl-CoA transferase
MAIGSQDAFPQDPWSPLRGLRVVDMADEKSELCGRILADLGAGVVRVEPPGGAPSRRLGPFYGDESLYFAVRNANKSNVEIDVSNEAGRGRLLGLLAEADIWIETTRPGQLAEIGLEPRAVARMFPELTVVSVTDFGQTGPYRDYLATDSVMEAMAWMLFRAGVPELPPVLPPGSLAYDMVGVSAAFAALTACLERLDTGRGQYLDMSVMEAVAQLTDWGLTSYSVISKLGIYGEIRDGGGRVYPILPCRDGFVRIGMVTLAEFRKVRSWIGEPEILMADYWDDQRTRLDLFDDLVKPLLVDFFHDKTMMELATDGQNRGIPITPMLTVADVLQADQYQVLGSFVDGIVGKKVGRLASGFLVADGQRVGYRDPAPSRPGPSTPLPAWPRRAGVSGAGSATAGRPYAGLRVVEFGVAGAVPEMARLLAEYGADAIRVESHKRPDLFRQLGGPTGVGSVFASSNRSTRSLGVDFTEPAGAEIVKELLKTADVVLENLPPGTLERFGLGPEMIRAVNPSVLLISSQTMGRRGPWSGWRGYGSNTQLPGGMSWLWTFPELPEPVPQNVAFPDHVVGRLGALTVAASMIGQRFGARPAQHVEIVQAEMALNLLADLFLQESLEPGTVRPRGNRSDRGVPWGVYRCAGSQRWCVITCRDDNEWQGLVSALGRPEWATSPALEQAEGRRAAQDDIDRHLSAWTAERSDREVMETMQQHGVPAGMMMYMSDQPRDPHLLSRGYILELDQPGVGPILLEGPAFHATGLPDPLTRPAPLLGQHTREICTGLLGYSDADVDALVAKGLLVEAEVESAAG